LRTGSSAALCLLGLVWCEASRGEPPSRVAGVCWTSALGLTEKDVIGEHFAAIPMHGGGSTWVRLKLGRLLMRFHQSASRLARLRKCSPSGATRKTANIGAACRSAKLIAAPANHGPFPLTRLMRTGKLSLWVKPRRSSVHRRLSRSRDEQRASA
jgi:hypothetical protein